MHAMLLAVDLTFVAAELGLALLAVAFMYYCIVMARRRLLQKMRVLDAEAAASDSALRRMETTSRPPT